MDREQKRKELTQIVVKSNDLIQKKRYSLTATQQKFLAYIISKIKPTDTINTMYEISVEDFCDLIGIDKTGFYTEFIKMIDKFDNDCFWIDTKDTLSKFRWFNDTVYHKGQGKVQLYLSRSLEQYLIGMTENFTKYELYNIMALKSKYSIRLFELFKSYAFQTQKQFDIDDLKCLLYCENYKNFKDFRTRVLEPAIKEINEYTELEIQYELATKGRKVIAITFLINKKKWMDAYRSYNLTLQQLEK